MIKYLGLLLASFVFSGCQHAVREPFISPSVGVAMRYVGDARNQTLSLKRGMQRIHHYGSVAGSPETKVLLGEVEELEGTLRHAEEEIKRLQGQIKLLSDSANQLTQRVNKLVADKQKWKGKQRKALIELWVWRGVMIGAVLWLTRGWWGSVLSFVIGLLKKI